MIDEEKMFGEYANNILNFLRPLTDGSAVLEEEQTNENRIVVSLSMFERMVGYSMTDEEKAQIKSGETHAMNLFGIDFYVDKDLPDNIVKFGNSPAIRKWLAKPRQ